MRRVKKAEIIEPTINITPLIDVVFVMLIAFIVIAPLLELDRIELAQGENVPSHMPVRFEDAGPIQVHVHSDNRISFNEQTVTAKELFSLLQEAKRKHPQVRPQLFHDKKAYFGTYQQVKNAFENAGFSELDIVLLPA